MSEEYELEDYCNCLCKYCKLYFANHKKCLFECDNELYQKAEQKR